MVRGRDFVKGFVAGFQTLGKNVVNAVNSILLAIVYFIVIGLVSKISKKRGNKFLDLCGEKKSTYWLDKNLSREPGDGHYRMF